MRKAIFVSMALLGMIACSKDQGVGTTPIKKSIPTDDDEIHETFLSFLAEHSNENYNGEEAVDMDYAVWLIEGSLNVTNMGNGTAANYVIPSSKVVANHDLSYTITGSGESAAATMTKEEMHNLFGTLVDDYTGKAAITDLEIVGNQTAGFQLQATTFNAQSAAPNPISYPCPANPVPGDAEGYVIISNGVPASCAQKSSMAYITEALTYQNQRHNNTCHLAYFTYAHSLRRLRVTNLPTAYNSLDWKLVANTGTTLNPVYVSAGTGQSHINRLYGASTYNGGPTSSSSTGCWYKSNIDPWVTQAQAIIDIEDPSINTTKYFTDAWVTGTTGSGSVPATLYGHHNIFFTQAREMPAAHISL